jgi:hypothetical protein
LKHTGKLLFQAKLGEQAAVTTSRLRAGN